MRRLFLENQRFGRLIVLERDLQNSTSKNVKWWCLCDCGTKTSAYTHHLKSGGTTSCGCFQKEDVTRRNTTHGMKYSTEYNSWVQMKDRCYNRYNKDYHRYGGRGIIICNRWINSFENFYEDMGVKPGSEYSIDRIDVNGNYEPSNCKWSTPKEQANNRRNNIKTKLVEDIV